MQYYVGNLTNLIIFARHHNSIHAVMVASKNATMVASKNDQVCKVSHVILHTRHTMSHTNMKLGPDMSQRVYVSSPTCTETLPSSPHSPSDVSPHHMSDTQDQMPSQNPQPT